MTVTPSYSFSQSAVGTVNEGANLVTTVQVNNFAVSDRVFWTAGGTGINAYDFAINGQGLQGDVALDISGRFTVTHNFALDNSTEGEETLELKFFSDSGRQYQIGSTLLTSIADTSITPIKEYFISQSASGAINEGAVLVTTVQTQNVAERSNVYWSASGIGTDIDVDDFSAGGLTGVGIVLSDGTFSFSHTFANDSKTEGNETLQVKLYSDPARTIQVGTTATTTITDSSKTPATYTITQSPSPAVSEGATLTTAVQTTDLAQGTQIHWSAGGVGVDADDFSFGTLAGTGTVGADGRFSLLHTLANDNKTEGSETLQVKLYSDAARTVQVGTTASTTITDTSKTPATYTISQSPIGNVSEGSNLVTTVQTQNLDTGTRL
jgi:hypothetical protein